MFTSNHARPASPRPSQSPSPSSRASHPGAVGPQAPAHRPSVPSAQRPSASPAGDHAHLSDEADDIARDDAHDTEDDAGARLGSCIRGAFDDAPNATAPGAPDARAFHDQIRGSVMDSVARGVAPALALRSGGSAAAAAPDSASPSAGASAPAFPGSSGTLPTHSPTADEGATGSLGSLGPALDRWDRTILSEAAKWGVPPERIKAMMALESGGDPNALQVNPTYGDTPGLMQINPKIWGGEAARLGYDLKSPEGQIGMASYLLREGYKATGSWDGASSWYFNPSGTGDSVNGTTNAQYVAKVNDYIAQMRR